MELVKLDRAGAWLLLIKEERRTNIVNSRSIEWSIRSNAVFNTGFLILVNAPKLRRVLGTGKIIDELIA